MSEIVKADAATRNEVLAAEERRRQALLAVDIPALEDLYDDSIVHIHAPGVTHNKTQLLEHVATRQAYVDMVRGDLNIRVVGEVAIMTGQLTNRLRSPDGRERTLSGPVTQVLRRCDDDQWRFVSFQMTPEGEQVWGALPSERQPADNSEKD
jgi:ketosteroid isomerase-like protein